MPRTWKSLPFHSWNINSVVIILALIGVGIFQAGQGPRPLDDAYITFRYARNVCQGNGFVYNPGEPVLGTTTPAFTLMLAGICLSGGADNLPIAAFIAALAADVLNIWLLFRLTSHLIHQRAAWLVAGVFMLQPLRLNVAVGGMETSLFILLLLAMVDRLLIGKNLLAAALLAALAVFTRPDAVLAVAPVYVYALVKYRQKVIGPTLAAILVLLPWLIWATLFFGNPLPQSILAKEASYQNYSMAASLFFLLTFLGTGTVGPYDNLLLILPGLIPALFLIVIGFRQALEKNPQILILAGYPVLYFVVMISNHAPLFFTWYYLPLMPGIILLMAAALNQLIPPAASWRGWPLQPVGLALTGLLLVGIPCLFLQYTAGWSIQRSSEVNFQRASQAVHQQVGPNALVMAPDIGVIGWTLEQARILDPIGLVSPISLEIRKDQPDWAPFMVELARKQQPDFIIGSQTALQPLLEAPALMAAYPVIWRTSSETDSGYPVLVLKRVFIP